MNLSQLETYRAILSSGSTMGAAEMLGISQSAASRRLAQLEEELGLELFVRDKSRLLPTQESRLLDRRIQDVLDRTDQLMATASDLRNGNSAVTTLRVAFPASLTLTVVPSIVAGFLRDRDRVLIEVMTGPYNTIERMVRDDQVDLGFVRIPVQEPALALTPIVEARSVCVLPFGHPLRRLSVITPKDLASEPLVLLGRQRSPRKDVDLAFWNAGIRPNVRVEAHSVGTACGFTAQGIGLTIVNALMVADYLHLPIEIRPFRPNLVHRFAFAVSERLPISLMAESFMAHCGEKLRELVSKSV